MKGKKFKEKQLKEKRMKKKLNVENSWKKEKWTNGGEKMTNLKKSKEFFFSFFLQFLILRLFLLFSLFLFYIF